ncbi:MAG TPA: thiolase family protein [Steroidobacteraceae bacterium]|nr:thiolase family protein [Steroidobacteraceae bacterium]
MTSDIEIPYGCYWSSPFAKWQGALQHLHSIEFAAWECRRQLERRSIDGRAIDYAALGTTVIQQHGFYGLPWLTGLAGLGHVTGPTISQACATGVRLLLSGVQEIASGLAEVALTLSADRCSNSAHVYYPDPKGPGGTGTHEDWLLEAFACDPLGKHSMLQTAENVARKHAISTKEQHDVVLRRLEQYGAATANDHTFQRRYMSLPFEVPSRDFKKIQATLQGDEGIFESTAAGLAKLKPLIPGGTVTFGGQTHPADGHAAVIVAKSGRAAELSRDPSIRIEVLGFGQARADLGYMPEATVPAARAALQRAGIAPKDLAATKTHNPFAVNDIVLARGLEIGWENINNYGCSLIWGHPNGPTGLRSIVELIEELVLRGGGYGLFTGCAAGDSAMAVVIKVGTRKSA